MTYYILGGRFYDSSELYHHGIEGQRWGVRRFQNEDGSLTAEGRERYSDSLTSIYDGHDENDDYKLSKGTSFYRRVDSSRSGDFGERPYTYTYDYDNETDDGFYKGFGRKVTAYSLANDAVLAGRKTLGEAYVNKMLELTDENDIRSMRGVYADACRRTGEKYVNDLFTIPYNPSAHVDSLRRVGADAIARMLSKQRSEQADEEARYDGKRDLPTAANDIGRSIVANLLSSGYSGMRDYTDYGSPGASVTTPTVVFDPGTTLRKLKQWLDD